MGPCFKYVVYDGDFQLGPMVGEFLQGPVKAVLLGL